MSILIDNFVRDVTKVTPMPKSEVRRRLEKIIAEEINKTDRRLLIEIFSKLGNIRSFILDSMPPAKKK